MIQDLGRLFYSLNLTGALCLGVQVQNYHFFVKKQYRQHNERVQSVIPQEKLLAFNVKQGWRPLCAFLGCDVPEKSFPKENVKASFAKDEISRALHNFVFYIFMGATVMFVIASAVLVFM